MPNSTNKKNIKITPQHFLVLFFIALIIIFTIYVNDFYKADYSTLSNINYINPVKKSIDTNNNIIYSSNSNTDTAMILYPGGKVEYSSYEALASICADLRDNNFYCKNAFKFSSFKS